MEIRKDLEKMLLLLKNKPLLSIQDNGVCKILDFDRLPFALRKKDITFVEFVEWASNRTLSIGRSYAKEILNAMRLSQNNRYAVCKACRGLSLEDSYWIRQEGDEKTWEEVNLFQNPLSLFVTEISLSGRTTYHQEEVKEQKNIHTPELTTLGASAKGWIRQGENLFLHKVGKYEIPADEILTALQIDHIHYEISREDEIAAYLSEERRGWIEGVGERIVNSKLFTSENISMVTFEEFKMFCESYGMNAYKEAEKLNPKAYLEMQIADYILNNHDRHEQNWGFLMENISGKIIGYCPLFDHDHTFGNYQNVMSQTTDEILSLYEAAVIAQKELKMNFDRLEKMKKPELLRERQWAEVLERGEKLSRL